MISAMISARTSAVGAPDDVAGVGNSAVAWSTICISLQMPSQLMALSKRGSGHIIVYGIGRKARCASQQHGAAQHGACDGTLRSPRGRRKASEVRFAIVSDVNTIVELDRCCMISWREPSQLLHDPDALAYFKA